MRTLAQVLWGSMLFASLSVGLTLVMHGPPRVARPELVVPETTTLPLGVPVVVPAGEYGWWGWRPYSTSRRVTNATDG